MKCRLTVEATAVLSLSLLHNAYKEKQLGVGSKQIPILGAPQGGCSNQKCDSCSSYNGNEYCFVCREGQYASNG